MAPDFLDAIITGDIPERLALGRLKPGIPHDSKTQRDLVGFAWCAGLAI
jgi:hypothetical protein